MRDPKFTTKERRAMERRAEGIRRKLPARYMDHLTERDPDLAPDVYRIRRVLSLRVFAKDAELLDRIEAAMAKEPQPPAA